MAQYDFTSLSPADFEVLMRDLLRAEYGWELESFASGPDGGVDLIGTSGDATIIVQCKHYAGSRFNELKRAVTEEIPKVQKENPSVYILATTQSLTRAQKTLLRDLLSPWMPRPEYLLSKSEINALIERHSSVENKHFKLWMASTGILQRIVLSGLWQRSEALMENVEDRVKVYVPNQTFTEAAKILEAERVVVINGSPGVGKSMLAEMLALNYWYRDWQIVTLNSSIEEGWSAWQQNVNQFFLFDDFLGQTDINERNSINEGSSIERFIARVGRSTGKRFVLTTRSHIVRQAQIRSEPLARSVGKTNEFFLDVNRYQSIERAKILYNHLYFSPQSRNTVKEFAADRTSYTAIIRHANFSPRIIEQILRRRHSPGTHIANAIISTFERPLQLWGPSFETALSETGREILLLLLCHPIDGVFERTLRNTVLNNANPIQYKHAMKSLEGSWVEIYPHRVNSDLSVRFANPSCRDFIISFVDENPEYFDFYLSRLQSLDEVCALLRYATATTANDGNWKYPKLNRKVGSGAEDLSKLLASKSDSLMSATLLDHRAEANIRSLIELDCMFSLRVSSWLPLALVEATPNFKLSHSPSAESAGYVVRYLISQKATFLPTIESPHKIRSAFRVWVLEWISASNCDEDWNDIIDTLTLIEGSELECEDDDSLIKHVRDAATAHYRRELSIMLSLLDYEKVESEVRLNRIRDAGTTIGITDAISTEFEAVCAALRVVQFTEFEEFSTDEEEDDQDMAYRPSEADLVPRKIDTGRRIRNASTDDYIDRLFDNLK